MNLLSKVLLFLTLSISLSSFAGQLRGGGDGVDENGQWVLLDMVEIYDLKPMTLTSYPFFASEFIHRYKNAVSHCSYPFYWLSSFQKQINFNATRYIHNFPNEREHRIRNRYTPNNDQFQSILSTKFNVGTSLPKEIAWYLTDKDLEEIPDEGAIRLPGDDVTKKQLAIQQNGVVIIYRPIFDKLSEKDKAALIFHEIVLSMQMLGNPNFLKESGTVDVRKFVQFIFNLPAKADTPFSHFEQYCGWNGSFFANLNYNLNLEWAGSRESTYRLEVTSKN